MIAQGEKSLRGLRVFLVEDEALVAMLLEHMLSDMGGVIVGQAHNVVGALTQMEQMAWSADVAILDINLAGEAVYPVADALAERGIPFLFATGYGETELDHRSEEHTSELQSLMRNSYAVVCLKK